MNASSHPTATREQWLTARLELLEAEKQLTRQSDAVARRRQALPWVPVQKEYRFQTEDGPASLAELFGGRSQLLVYQFMFGPEFTAGCPSCSAIADGFDRSATHLENHDVAFVAVSRGPIEKLAAYRRRMGWTFRWASSLDSDFNYDFSSSFTETQMRGIAQYNFAELDMSFIETLGPDSVAGRHAASAGVDAATFLRERPGMSAFVLQDGAVHHTYSAYARGLDGLWPMYQWLDRAPLGRNETGAWWQRRDEYSPTA
ncbi:MAG: DUF899 domain-containing protein [Solirubrobacteraceae bacterium]